SVFALSGTITGHPADAQPQANGTVTNATVSYARVGASGGLRRSVVHVFQIPGAVLADATQQFATATYTIKMGSGSPPVSGNADLYGLTFETIPTVLPGDHYAGAFDSGASLLQDNIITPA